MTQARGAVLAVAALALFVALSSWLGLAGRFLVTDPASSFAFMGGIWRASLLADAAFVAGSLTAAIVAHRLVARVPIVFAVLASGLLNWGVYAVSFLLLPSVVKEGLGGIDAPRVLLFVGMWGIFGLVFAAVAPPLAARWWATRARPAGTETGAPAQP